MYFSKIRKYLKDEVANIKPLDNIGRVIEDVGNDELLCIMYDKNNTAEVYLLYPTFSFNDEIKKTERLWNFFKIREDKKELEEINDDNLLRYFLSKKAALFYSEANYAIGRNGGKKDDFAVFVPDEAIINYKTLMTFSESDIESYLTNKKNKFKLSFYEERVKKKKIKILGSENDKEKIFLNLIEKRIDNLKKNSMQETFEQIFSNFVSKKIKSLDELNLPKKNGNSDEDSSNKIILSNKLKSLRVMFVRKPEGLNEELNKENAEKEVFYSINSFNDFFSSVSKQLKIEDSGDENYKLFYGIKTFEELSEKPLISKGKVFWEEEKYMFYIYFYLKYKIKQEKEILDDILTKKKFEKNSESLYKFKSQEYAIVSFDVLTRLVNNLQPVFYYFDLSEMKEKGEGIWIKEIREYDKLIEELDKNLNLQIKFTDRYNTKNEKKSIVSYFLDKEVIEKSFTSEEEIRLYLTNILKTLLNYEEHLLERLILENAKKSLGKDYYVILKPLAMLLSIKFYLENLKNNKKGVSMKETVKSNLLNLRKALREIIEDRDIVLDNETLSYIVGHILRYYYLKSSAENKTISMVIPVLQNIRTLKDAKEEINKAIEKYGYNDKLGYTTTKAVSFINSIGEDSLKLRKDYLIAGLFDNDMDMFYLKKEDNEE